MRKEYREYNYDAMIASCVHFGSLAKDGTEKECSGMLRYAPHFKETFEAILGAGEPGVLLLKLLDKYIIELMTAHERGMKIAMGTFTFPPGVLKPFGVIPMNLEPMTTFGAVMWERGINEYLNYCCELGFPETTCTGQRGSLGAYLAGLGIKPDFILCNCVGACDSNATAFNYAAEYMGLPFYQLNSPPSLVDERTRRYQRQDFRGLIAFIEEQTGKKMDVDMLKDVIIETDKQDKIMAELMELARLKPSPVPGIFHFMAYSIRFVYGGSKEATEFTELMLRIAKKNLAQGRAGTTSGREDARVMSTYIDHYAAHLRPWTWYDSKNISYLGGTLEHFWYVHAPYAKGLEEGAYVMDPTNLDTMIDSLADQMSRMPMVKQLRGPYDSPHQWLSDTRAILMTFKPDFFLYTSTIGCRNTWSAIKMLSRDIEKMGIPSLVLFSDSFDNRIASWGSMKDRLEEFLQVRGILK
jgi:hypothetical protein